MCSALVAYATRFGSTRQIAESICQRLLADRINADLREVVAVESLDGYDAVILGTAIYLYRWLPEAVEFLRRFDYALQLRPVWLFCSGPTSTRTVVELLDDWRYPEDLRDLIRRIAPRDLAVFHGRVDRERLHWWMRWLLKPAGMSPGDYRQWDLIQTWSAQISRELNSSDRIRIHG